jgi:hypothetical protein
MPKLLRVIFFESEGLLLTIAGVLVLLFVGAWFLFPEQVLGSTRSGLFYTTTAIGIGSVVSGLFMIARESEEREMADASDERELV